MNIKPLLFRCCLLAALTSLLLPGCGPGKPPSPEEAAFKAANKKIYGKSDGITYGNTAEAKELAAEFSDKMETLQKVAFSGGKENRVFSMTGEKFLTYCQLNEDSVLFLVHVPQFKRYKGEVRDALNELAWLVANGVTEDYRPGQPLKVSVGLRGSIMYGGSAVGQRGGEPKYQNSFSISDDIFYGYFKQDAATPAPAAQ